MRWPWVFRRRFETLHDQLVTRETELAYAERENEGLGKKKRELSARVEDLRSQLDERDRLREQNDRLLEHLARMDRVEHGVSEQPRPAKPALEPMPDDLKRYIDGYANSSQRGELRKQANKRYRDGTPWSVIRREVMQSELQDRTAP